VSEGIPPPLISVDDLRLREAELLLSRERFSFEKEIELRKVRGAWWSTGIVLAIVSALSAVVLAFIQGYFNRQLEREKFVATAKLENQKLQSSVILKAIEADSSSTAIKNLRFFRDLGLLDDPAHRIANVLPSEAPVLPTSRLIGESPTLRVDAGSYCRDRYGARYHPSDGRCSDGKNNYDITPADLCKWRTGSPELLVDPSSLAFTCKGLG